MAKNIECDACKRRNALDDDGNQGVRDLAYIREDQRYGSSTLDLCGACQNKIDAAVKAAYDVLSEKVR